MHQIHISMHHRANIDQISAKDDEKKMGNGDEMTPKQLLKVKSMLAFVTFEGE